MNWRRISRVGPRRNPRWKLRRSSGEATSLGLRNFCTDGRLPDAMPLGASRAVGCFWRESHKSIILILHFTVFLCISHWTQQQQWHDEKHVITYSIVQSDAQVGGSQASPRWNKFENAWKVKHGIWFTKFSQDFPPKSRRSLVDHRGLPCHVSHALPGHRCHQLRIGPNLVMRITGPAAFVLSFLSFLDLLNSFDLWMTRSHVKGADPCRGCWVGIWVRDLSASALWPSFGVFTLAEAGRAGGHKARLRKMWWEQCRKTASREAYEIGIQGLRG